MRDDLLDAQAAVDWGISQLPILAGRLRSWQETGLETVIVDLNPQTGRKALVVRERAPLPTIVHAEVGAIIGSFRSSLDLLAASLAKRNGVTPSRKTHFPIFQSIMDFIDPKDGLEAKKWLSDSERRKIKTLEPYDGGNGHLWALHQLDILRKHERLIAVMIKPRIEMIVASKGSEITIREGQRLKAEATMFEFTAGMREPEAQFTVDIMFDKWVSDSRRAASGSAH